MLARSWVALVRSAGSPRWIQPTTCCYFNVVLCVITESSRRKCLTEEEEAVVDEVGVLTEAVEAGVEDLDEVVAEVDSTDSKTTVLQIT